MIGIGIPARSVRLAHPVTPVTITLAGELALPAKVQVALYRICQESLTNALKHAGPGARVLVSVAWGKNTVDLTIADSGGSASQPYRANPDAGLGLGLIGMRERAELVGGSLHAGPSDSGFRVQAQLPLLPLEGNEA